MAYTPQDILTRVQRQFGDESGVQVTQDDVMRWIDDAFREIYTQNPDLFIVEEFINSVAGQNDYSLSTPSNVQSILNVSYKDSGQQSYYALNFITPIEFDKWAAGWDGADGLSGAPRYYSKGIGSPISFILFPTPDLSLTNAIKVKYARSAPAINSISTDLTAFISSDYFQLILEFCLMKAYEMDENWEAADRKGQYVQTTLNMLGFKGSWVNQEQYPLISLTDEF